MSPVASIGIPVMGGLITMGDAAHCFPPNLGLGVSSALEDVSILMSIIDNANVDIGVAEIAKRYEAMRDEDVWVLV